MPYKTGIRLLGVARNPANGFPARLLGDLVIDYAMCSVTIVGVPVEPTPLEYRLLVELSANAGRLLTHEQMLQRLWAGAHLCDEAP